MGYALPNPLQKRSVFAIAPAQGKLLTMPIVMTVGMTGDEVYDAPALKQADVGVADSSVTYVAKAATSLFLTSPGLENLISAVKNKPLNLPTYAHLHSCQRKVITLRFIEGWENDEVASALGKPIGAKRALQFRALNTLRRLFVKEAKVGTNEPQISY